MANYSIVINSKFKPFSYQEMLAPVQQSTEAHQQIEEAYANLSSQAELVAGKANEQTDPIAYARYKAYADDLSAQADKLARTGLTPDDRRSMFNLRARYAKEIVPIQEAIETRKKQAEQQQQALLQNPTLLLGRRAATTSLDEYLKNPELGYDSYSGALLTSQVSQQAQALAKELTSYGKGKPIDEFTNTFLKQHGFTSAQVLQAINNPNDPSSSPVLKALVDQTLASSGIPNWGDEATLARARAFANQGLYSAVGQTDVSPLENYGARENLKFQHQVALENLSHQHAMARQRAAAASAAAATPSQNPSIPISVNPIVSKVDRSRLAEASKFTNFFKRDKNGKVIGLTDAGVKEYNRVTTKKRTITDRAHGEEHTVTETIHSPLFDYITKLNGGVQYKKGAKAVNGVEIAKLYDREMANMGASGGNTGSAYYDAYAIKATQRNFDTSKDYQEGLKSAIVSARMAGGGSAKDNLLYQVQWDSKRNQYVRKGDGIGYKTLMDEGTVILGSERSARGMVYRVKTKNGNFKTYEIPKELNASSYDNAQGAYKRAEFYQRLVGGHANRMNFSWYANAFGSKNDPAYKEAKALYDQAVSGKQFTDSQMALLGKVYSDALLNAEENADNMYWQTKTEDYKNKPF